MNNYLALTSKLIRTIFLISLIGLLSACGGGGGGDAPGGTTGGTTGGAFSPTGFGFGFGETADPSVEIWKFSEASDDITSPAISADGTIYIGSKDKYLYAINSDGSLKWKFRTETGTGIESPAAIGNDSTIYIVDVAETIYAINLDGTKKWSIANIGGGGVSVADNGAILIGGYSLSPFDGSNYWYLGINPQKKPVLESIRSDTVYLVSGNSLLAQELLLSTRRWAFTANDTINTTPAIGADGTLYFGDQSGIIYAVNDDGTEKWRFVVDPNEVALNSPVIGLDGMIYISFSADSGDSKLYAFTKEGALQWEHRIAFGSDSPVIGEDGTIYITTNTMTALNTDGTLKWEAVTYRNGRAAPIIDDSGFLYAPLRSSLYKLNVDAGGRVDSAWPMRYGDVRNTSAN